MKIDYDGRAWEFDVTEMDVGQCEAVEKYVGKGLGEWANQLAAGSIKSVAALWWVVRAQAGYDPGPIGQPDPAFRPVKLLAAFNSAEEAEAAAQVPQPQPEPEPGPTPAGGSPLYDATRMTLDSTRATPYLPG